MFYLRFGWVVLAIILTQGCKSTRANWVLTEQQDRRSFHSSTYTNSGAILKMDVYSGVDKEAAQMLTRDGIMGLEALYANALSPYPGDISHSLVTDARVKPRFAKKIVNGMEYQFFLLFSNERLGYGAMTQDLIKYKSLLGWFHCEAESKLYKARLFVPVATSDADLTGLFLKLGCQPLS